MTRGTLHPVYKAIGTRIREQRIARNMKQKHLSSVVGFSNSTSISEIEQGCVRIQFDMLLTIASMLECPVSILLPEYMRSEDITEHCEVEHPQRFEDKTLAILHDAFMDASHILAGMKPSDEHYWDILHASENILKAMGEVENAAYEWRSFLGIHDWGIPATPEQEENTSCK